MQDATDRGQLAINIIACVPPTPSRRPGPAIAVVAEHFGFRATHVVESAKKAMAAV